MRYFTCFDLLTLNFSQCVTALSYSPPNGDGGMWWSVTPSSLLLTEQGTGDYYYWSPGGDLLCADNQSVTSYI